MRPVCATVNASGLTNGRAMATWATIVAADFEAMALAMMRANPDAAREPFRIAQDAIAPTG